MRKHLKYFFIIIVIASLWAVIWSSNATVGHELPHLPLPPPDSTNVGDSASGETGDMKYPFEDYDGLTTPGAEESSPLYLGNPSNINTSVEYNPETNEYEIREKIGDLDYRHPRSMTLEEYKDYDFDKSIHDYWRQRYQGESFTHQRSLIPKLHIGSEVFDRIFGSNTIDIRPQGSAELIFGINISKIDNPQLSEKLRKTWTFDFQEKIQMNVTGQIGDKLKLATNYNTEASFDFENKMNLAYEGKEDEIIQKVEAGDVTLPLTGSLISGSQSLFGIKTELQFGKLTATTVFSQQKGKTQVIEVEGGAQTNYFEVDCDEYEANKHFFLAHYFRELYNDALDSLPLIRSGIKITNVEVWITNKTGNYEESRNILALMDLGEGTDYIFASSSVIDTSENGLPSNEINNLYSSLLNNHPQIRNFNNITGAMSGFVFDGFVAGQDFEKIESARKLDPQEYKLNADLGFISLNSALNADEILAVAFEYTVQGETGTYRVGEISSSGPSAPQTLVVKLLKGTSLTPKLPTWNLMMKNVYALGAYQVSSEEFYLNIFYNDPKTGMPINYLPENDIFGGRPLLQIMNLDRLNSQQDEFPDGIFDFVNGVTINSSNGRVYFPVLEPFGEDLLKAFGSGNEDVASKYLFNELYDSTQTIAQQIAEKNRFILKGSYQSSSGSDIALNAFNVPQGSVVVTAGGRTLTENVDYTVDYALGRVKIINQGLLESGTPIKISLESNSLFSIQSKTLIGTHLDYKVSKDLSIGGTILNLTERPLTQKVNIGDEPISNTIWGLDGTYRTEAPFLTKLVDLLPFIETKETSTITMNAEFAHLIPGHSRAIEKEGVAYIDDFEGSKTSLDIRSVSAWKLASTPQGQPALFRGGEKQNDIGYGFHRAKLGWYVIDPILVREDANKPPPNITDDEMSDHYVREVYEKEIFPNKESISGVPTYIPVLNLAYYPDEKGPYNYNTEDIDSTGNLKYPENNWAGIMRKIETSDFEAANIEYIEFWMMDPFADPDDNGPKVPYNSSGGYLYFNLGNISEDILNDSRKMFENGLPVSSEVTMVDTTVWGRVPVKQSMVNAFDNNTEARQYQDVGLDGLGDEEEKKFFGSENPYGFDYLAQIAAKFGPGSQAYINASEDPSNDNFHYFRGTDYDEDSRFGDILERYRMYNGLEGNSPTSEQSQEDYPTQATNLPDNEDINWDNNLSEAESYFQYRVPIFPGMDVGEGYITDKVVGTPTLPNGESRSVTWYQFKIPIQEPDSVIGSILDFKSVRFVRMLLNGFSENVVLRFASLDLVRGEWRKYKYSLREAGEWSSVDDQSGSFVVSAVNIEENGDRYVLPPGIERVIDPSNPHFRQLNEQSIVLKAIDMVDGDARAAFKNANLDIRQYKKLQMEVHAEAIDEGMLQDGEMRVFIRLGSDYKQNYYEYEIPLELTPFANYPDNDNISDEDRRKIWPESNRFDFEFTILQELKQLRNAEARKEGSLIRQGGYMESWDGKNRVIINGNPNLADIRTIMIGLRNPKAGNNPDSDDGMPKSVEVWLNEMRLTDFDEKGGWAANARVAARLADFGSLNIAGSTSRRGFGSIEKKVNERSKEDIYQYDISSNLDLGKFFPEKARVSVPMYVGYTENISNPQYSPLDPDIPLDDVLDDLGERYGQDSARAYKKVAQQYEKRKSVNFTNIRINNASPKPRIYSISNFGINCGYNGLESRDIATEHHHERRYNGGFMYNYSTSPKHISPFQKTKFKPLNSPWLRLIKDFNFSPLPNQLSFRTDLNRNYRETKLRDIAAADVSVEIPMTVRKDLTWNRIYDLKYDLTKALKIDFNATNAARINEPDGRVVRKKSYPGGSLDTLYMTGQDWWQNEAWPGLKKGGRNTNYKQSVNVSYNLPINKLPPLNWVTANARYRGDFEWLSGPMNKDEQFELGHTIKNSNNSQINGQLNFLNLYNKIPYLKEINQKARKRGRDRKKETKTEKVRYPEKGQPKKEIKLKANEPKSIFHKLGTDDVEVKVFDDKGKPVKGEVKVITYNKVTFTADKDYDVAMVEVIGTKEIKESTFKIVFDKTLGVIMGIKNLNVAYSITDGSMLPGYDPTTRFFGLSSHYAPGVPYVFGWVEEDFGTYAGEQGWITGNDDLYEPFTLNHNTNLTVRSSIEPVPGMRIDVNGSRMFSRNLTAYVEYDPDKEEYVYVNEVVNGNFSMSFNTMRSAFKGFDKAYSSVIFEEFSANRQVISQRLADARMADPGRYGSDYGQVDPENQYVDSLGNTTDYRAGYGPTSPDVLIPAFIAAYTGQSAEEVDLNVMPPAFSKRNGKWRMNLAPNWRVTYDGLKNVKYFKKYLKTITLTHAYRSTYSVGTYASNTYFRDAGFEDPVQYNYAYDQENNFYPEFDINSISINEQFSPLIGIDMTWINSLISKVEIKKSRNLSMSFSNNWMNETVSNDYIIGSGYRFKDVPLLINKKHFQSDLNLRADLSIRSNLTVIRKLEEHIDELTAGQTVITIKLSADYVLSDRFNIKIFYDRVVNKPKISRTFPRANTNFGISIRFTLSQ
ncbi:MAG: cell surface protein SprA [Bacteroidetes bacterium]|nr:cell surface protein SprA [Bacteroidota bacterium]